MHAPFTHRSVGMDADAHDSNTGIDELATDLPQRRDRLPNVFGDVGFGLEHRLEELPIDVASQWTCLSNDARAPISQLIVRPYQQQLLFHP
jgi:hypothetical protein